MFQISLRAARVNAGYTQDAASKKIKVDKSTMIKWEQGKTAPRADQLKSLCELYNIPMDYIFLNK